MNTRIMEQNVDINVTNITISYLCLVMYPQAKLVQGVLSDNKKSGY